MRSRGCRIHAQLSFRLGDRHGENILFEEGNGGTFHVDFNCLFDKVWCLRMLTFPLANLVPGLNL